MKCTIIKCCCEINCMKIIKLVENNINKNNKSDWIKTILLQPAIQLLQQKQQQQLLQQSNQENQRQRKYRQQFKKPQRSRRRRRLHHQQQHKNYQQITRGRREIIKSKSIIRWKTAENCVIEQYLINLDVHNEWFICIDSSNSSKLFSRLVESFNFMCK